MPRRDGTLAGKQQPQDVLPASGDSATPFSAEPPADAATPHPDLATIQRKLAEAATLRRQVAGSDAAIDQAAEERAGQVATQLEALRSKAITDPDAADEYQSLMLEQGALDRTLAGSGPEA